MTKDMTKDAGIVTIHGKRYKTVAKRVDEFREAHGTNYSIITSLVSISEETVVMRAEIADENQRIIATGYAEENRQASQINTTSALENCETSAIGRALANFGLAGGEYASADEVANAINQQGEAPKATQSRLDFDYIRETLKTIDDMDSIDTFAREVFKKCPRMTDKQKAAVKAIFDKRREGLNNGNE